MWCAAWIAAVTVTDAGGGSHRGEGGDRKDGELGSKECSIGDALLRGPLDCPCWPGCLSRASHCLQAAFVGAMAIADLVKTTLGPKGMVSSSALSTTRVCRSSVMLGMHPSRLHATLENYVLLLPADTQ